MTNLYTAYADGGKKDGATYGSCKIYNPDGSLLVHRQFYFGFGTSNMAEYLTLNKTLALARYLKIQDIKIFMDSQLVVGQLMWGWNCNYKHLQVLRDLCKVQMEKFTNFELVAVTRKILVKELGH